MSSASLLFPVVIVLNPANGQPECPKNSDWERALQQIAAAKDAGGNVKAIGYVSTDYTNVAIATAKAHVDTYFQCWNVSGIFFGASLVSRERERAALLTHHKQTKQRTTRITSPTTKSYITMSTGNSLPRLW